MAVCQGSFVHGRWNVHFTSFACVTKYFDFFQPLKNIKTILSLWAVQRRASRWAGLDLWAVVCRLLPHRSPGTGSASADGAACSALARSSQPGLLALSLHLLPLNLPALCLVTLQPCIPQGPGQALPRSASSLSAALHYARVICTLVLFSVT